MVLVHCFEVAAAVENMDFTQKCCLSPKIELSECNKLQNHGFQRFHQVAANFVKLLQSLSVAVRGHWMLSICEINAGLLQKL